LAAIRAIKVAAPNKVVMARRFGANPLLGERETTLTYPFDPSPHGTLVTVREEDFIGRAEADFGNAENWEKVLAWLDGHMSGRK
jgi:Activator of Hsp90 ATPase homolog 1-like protein